MLWRFISTVELYFERNGIRRTKSPFWFHNRRKAIYDETDEGHAYAEPSKGFYKPQGDLYFKTNLAVFTAWDAMARGIDMLMVMFRDDKNARKNDGQGQPCGH